MQRALRLDEIDIIHPERYVAHGYPHAEWTLLRREAPVYWFDRTEGERFWAITKHADIVFISKRPDLFISDPLLAVGTTPLAERKPYPKNLIQFDPPNHGVQRKLISNRFTPHALEARQADIERIARRVGGDLFTEGDTSEYDFVEKVAAPLSIAVIACLRV